MYLDRLRLDGRRHADQALRQAQAVAIDDPEKPAGNRSDATQRADLAIENDQRFLHRLFGIAGVAAGARSRRCLIVTHHHAIELLLRARCIFVCAKQTRFLFFLVEPNITLPPCGDD